MEAWVGPAIVAAFISGLVSLLVVQLNVRQERRTESIRRGERVRDFQIALRAEIMSDLLNMREADRSQVLNDMTTAFANDPHYTPVAPRIANNLIFEAIVSEIHILPDAVISPIVHYARHRQTLERFIDDLRSPAYEALAQERHQLAYADYLATYDRLQELAEAAAKALDDSLGLSRSALDRATQGSATAGASVGTLES